MEITYTHTFFCQSAHIRVRMESQLTPFSKRRRLFVCRFVQKLVSGTKTCLAAFSTFCQQRARRFHLLSIFVFTLLGFLIKLAFLSATTLYYMVRVYFPRLKSKPIFPLSCFHYPSSILITHPTFAFSFVISHCVSKIFIKGYR